MSFLRTYLYYNYKLAVRTRDRIKAPGLIFLGKLGDKIYKSPIVVIVYCIASLLILMFFAGYSAEVLPSDPIMGLNVILVAPAFFAAQILFDLFGLNSQLSSYQSVFIINLLSVKERVKCIFLTEFFGFKFFSLILCVAIVQIFNHMYLEITAFSLVTSLCFFVSLFVIHNSIISMLHPFISKVSNMVLMMLVFGAFAVFFILAEKYTTEMGSNWIGVIVELFDRVTENPYIILILFGLSLCILAISIFMTTIILRSSWRY